MLVYLRLKNYILIPEIELNFKEGFICFTGETGAGKSMILGSIELLKGERVDWKMFEGNKEVIIEGIFRFKPSEEVIRKYELDFENEIFVQRILDTEQKISKIRVNGTPVSAGVLKEIFENEIEIHGQQSQIYLLNKNNQLDMLDRYCDLSDEVGKFKELFVKYKQKIKEYEELQKNYERILTMKDFMEHSIKELEEINIENINTEELFDEYRKLNERKELKEKINEIVFELSESEDSVINKISLILKNEMFFKDSGKKAFELLNEAQSILNEALNEFVRMRFEEEEDEKKLFELENLLQKIEDLKRKHRTDEKGLVFLYKKWKEELSNFDILKKKLDDIEKEVKDIEEELSKRADKISGIRKKKAQEFKKEIEKILLKLGFSYINFEIKFSEKDIYEKGKDEIEFLLSSSKDRKPISISKVASGGELSRIMLAIKTLISEKDEKNLLIFDEIDTGIGGEVARIVGRNLKKLSKGKQVFCITHLPQIASFSDYHFYVYKEIKNGKAEIKVKELKSIEERKKEIARMIAGKKIDDSSLSAAEKLIEEGLKV